MNTRPKSYMTDEDRARRRAGGMSENAILMAESRAADHAGDEDAAWAWLALAETPTAKELQAVRNDGTWHHVADQAPWTWSRAIANAGTRY